jgi:hypothetical protein
MRKELIRIYVRGITEGVLSGIIGSAGKAILMLLVGLSMACGSLTWPGCACAAEIAADSVASDPEVRQLLAADNLPQQVVLQASAAAPGPVGEGPRPGEPYHTPLAGVPGHARVFGYPVEIPAIDRSHMTSITLGASLLHPRQGDTRSVPFAALWLRRVWDDARTRDLISVFSNELEYDKSLGRPFELIGHFENFTLPVARQEIFQNHDVNSTSVLWGTLIGSLGAGLRFPMAPGEVDNDLRIQLLGRGGYFYAVRNADTGADQILPPRTFLYGAKLRVRYDGLRRNLLELPHLGFATGFDIDYLVRDEWRDLEARTLSAGNREFLQASGYFVGAGGVPGLSERNRLLLSVYGGTTGGDRGDRYNAFRINGGPYPSESDDLPRQRFTGLVFDDILATRYATAAVGYRRELTFFLYLSLIGSYIWAERASALDSGRVFFKEDNAWAGTASLDCAFFWKSSIYLAYSWDTGILRSGKSGSGLVLTWNKLF